MVRRSQAYDLTENREDEVVAQRTEIDIEEISRSSRKLN